MLKLERDTILVGISELRNNARKVLKEAMDNKVILEIRHKPQAVIVPVKKYEIIEKLLDLIEDEYFGKIATERMKREGKEYISSEEMERLLGIK